MSFSAHLRELADPIWRAQREHPFLLGIGDGSLPLEKFRYWVRQDYLFLIDYARLFALAAARSPDLDTMLSFAELLHSTLKTEMELHRSFAAQFGITPAELQAEPKAPTTQAYTDFLLRLASLGEFSELAAALLPCMWGFSEIGLHLAESASRKRPNDERYAQWIEMYASAEFAELATWCRELVDRLAMGAGPAQRARMEQAFLISSQFEYRFWDMAYREERWAVGRAVVGV